MNPPQQGDGPRRTDSRVWLILSGFTLVVAAILPGLWWAAADEPFLFRRDLFITMTAASLVFAFTTSAAIAKLSGAGPTRTLGISTIVMLVFFNWHPLTRAGQAVASEVSLPLLSDLVPVLVAGAILWLGIRHAGERAFTAAMAVLVSVWATSLTTVVLTLLAPPIEDVATAGLTTGPPTLLMVLDAYPRNDFLMSQFDHDNSGFVAALEDRGFVVASEAAANYPYTWASVSAMMELEYIFPAGPVLDGDKSTMRTALSGESGLMATFGAAGYETVFHQNAWGGSTCGRTVDVCMRRGLTERGVWNLGQLTPLAPVLDAAWPAPIATNSKKHLESLPEILTDPSPRFTFAHVIVPHEPFVYNEACEVDRPTAEDFETYPHPVIGQLECTNRLALAAIDAMIEAHPDAIIMLTGDHGLISQLEAAEQGFTPRLATFSAYRVSACDTAVPPDISPVNGARLITNCALGAELDPLPDRHYWLTPTGFVDITDQIRG